MYPGSLLPPPWGSCTRSPPACTHVNFFTFWSSLIFQVDLSLTIYEKYTRRSPKGTASTNILCKKTDLGMEITRRVAGLDTKIEVKHEKLFRLYSRVKECCAPMIVSCFRLYQNSAHLSGRRWRCDGSVGILAVVVA